MGLCFYTVTLLPWPTLLPHRDSSYVSDSERRRLHRVLPRGVHSRFLRILGTNVIDILGWGPNFGPRR